MGSLIEAVLIALLVGIFTLLGVWLAGWQERKRAREAHEARKKEIVFEKQLEALEETVKWLTLLLVEWKRRVAFYKKWSKRPNEPSEERVAEFEAIEKIFIGVRDESIEVVANLNIYMPFETVQEFQEYCALVTAIGEGMEERLLLREENVDFEGTKEQLDVAYKATVSKMREHLGIRLEGALAGGRPRASVADVA